MVTYEFKSIDEFVSYLDTCAKGARDEQKKAHIRSHAYIMHETRAHTLEQVATMVRASNIVVVTDYMRAALSKGVG